MKALVLFIGVLVFGSACNQALMRYDCGSLHIDKACQKVQDAWK